MTAVEVRPGRVEVHGVHKSYAGVEVLHGVDLVVEPGTVTVILGPSGSGKSTLLRSINHLEKVDRGFVALDGELVGYRRKGNTLPADRGSRCGCLAPSRPCDKRAPARTGPATRRPRPLLTTKRPVE